VNFCFPHYFLLPTFGSASSYGSSLGPEECLFELWSLTRFPPGTERAAEDPTRWAGRPALAAIPQQDFSNLPRSSAVCTLRLRVHAPVNQMEV